MNSTKLTGKLPGSDAILVPEDLRNWSFPGSCLAVLGHPIGHSISPQIHNAALGEMSRHNADFRDWRYFRFDVASGQLKECLAMFSKLGFRGLNLTIPHKVEALEALDWIDSEAAEIGAVNTLVFRANGRCEGYNTDGQGLERALKENFGFPLRGGKIILLGAGGAARAAATRFLREGCSELWIGNRSSERMESLIKTLAPNKDQKVQSFLLDNVPSKLLLSFGPSTLVVNATSLGLAREDDSPFDFSQFPEGGMAYDMIYNPAETTFLRNARTNGLQVSNGLSMLVHQAARSLRIWTGSEVPVEPMFAAAKEVLEERVNTA